MNCLRIKVLPAAKRLDRLRHRAGLCLKLVGLIRPQAELPLYRVGDAAAGLAVPVGIHRMGHGVVGPLIVQQFRRQGEDLLLLRASTGRPRAGAAS